VKNTWDHRYAIKIQKPGVRITRYALAIKDSKNCRKHQPSEVKKMPDMNISRVRFTKPITSFTTGIEQKNNYSAF